MRSALGIATLLALLSSSCGHGSSDSTKPAGPDKFPYTPKGCDYAVSAPDGVDDVAMSSSATGAAPTPKQIHVSWAGAPESTFAVNWATDLDTKLTEVLYGSDENAVKAADGPTSGVTRQLGHTMQFGSPLFADQKMRVHEVHVCGLAANTTYYYKVGGPGAWSDVYDVATAPPRGTSDKFEFLADGDSRSDPSVFAQIQQQASSQGVDFEIFSGDVIDINANQTQWEAFFESTSGSYAAQDMLARRQFMPVNGNHDNLSVYYVGEFALPQDVSPGEMAEGEEWYSFDYANAHFVMLDTEASKLADQTAFMQDDLAKVDRTKTPWVIAVFHKTPYSCASTHKSDSDAPRAAWQPVFDQFKVDLVIAGHVHNYQRSLPIRGFKSGTTDGVPVTADANGAPVAESGTLYTVTGGAGADLYGVDPASTCDFSKVTEKTNNYLLIEIENRTLRYKALRLDGTEIESFEYTK